MKCDRCNKNEATITYTETVMGKSTKYNLCAECAAKLNPGSAIGGMFGNSVSLIESLIGNMFGSEPAARTTAPAKKCDLCGITLGELMKEGKAGCPRCYSTFEGELERTVAKIHGSTAHRGKVPEAYQEKMDKAARIEELRGKITDAVASENYEEAARLRDMIRSIEEDTGNE